MWRMGREQFVSMTQVAEDVEIAKDREDAEDGEGADDKKDTKGGEDVEDKLDSGCRGRGGCGRCNDKLDSG